MKFKDRKEARDVREVMASLLLPLINHLDVRTRNACEITLRILAETDQEPVFYPQVDGITPTVIKPKQRWIPVSERLPEDRREVLVTAYWHETYQVMMASYYGDGLWWCVPFNNCGKHMRNDLHVIAWMPLPKPYEVEPQERSEE